MVIANSRYTADLIASRYGTPRERMEVIHRGVDAGAFDPQAHRAGSRCGAAAPLGSWRRNSA